MAADLSESLMDYTERYNERASGFSSPYGVPVLDGGVLDLAIPSTFSSSLIKCLERLTQVGSIIGIGPGFSSSFTKRVASEEILSKGLRLAFKWAESQPELKGSQDFLALHQSLVQVEKKIQGAEQEYNAVAPTSTTRHGPFSFLGDGYARMRLPSNGPTSCGPRDGAVRSKLEMLRKRTSYRESFADSVNSVGDYARVSPRLHLRHSCKSRSDRRCAKGGCPAWVSQSPGVHA